MKKELLWAVVLLCGQIGVATGQEAMGLEECRRLAVENNKKLQMADIQVKAAHEKKREAFTKYLPGIDAAGMYLWNQKEISLLGEDASLPVGTVGSDGKWTMRPDQVMLGPDGMPVMNNGVPVPKDYALLPKEAVTLDIRNTALVQVGLTQPVYMGGKIRAYNQLAGMAEQLAESGRAVELGNVIEQTDEAYWQIVSLASRKGLAEKYVETLKRFTHDVESLFKNGMGTKADMLSVKVKLNQAEMALMQVENGLALARMALNQVCGLPVDTVFTLREELSGAPELQPGTVSAGGPGLEEVFRNRAEVASLKLATDIYKRKERIARSEFLPTVALTVNYMAMTPSFSDGISNKFNGAWSAGVGVKAPIFHWGASRKSVRSARAETELAALKLEEAKEMIELQVSQARFKIKEAWRKREVAEENLAQAEENLKYADRGFREGMVPVSNVLEAQTAWLAAHSEVVDARIEVKLCEVYLKKAYGTLAVGF